MYISNAVITAIFIMSKVSNVRGNTKTDCWKECKGIQTSCKLIQLPNVDTVHKVAGIPQPAAGARFTQPFD